jgi:hypothetical protein
VPPAQGESSPVDSDLRPIVGLENRTCVHLTGRLANLLEEGEAQRPRYPGAGDPSVATAYKLSNPAVGRYDRGHVGDDFYLDIEKQLRLHVGHSLLGGGGGDSLCRQRDRKDTSRQGADWEGD